MDDSISREAAIDEWAAWKQAEAEGRLIVLPQKLYEVAPPGWLGVGEWDVTGVLFYNGKVQEYIVKNSVATTTFRGDEIGGILFLSYEEAEAVLKEAQK